MTAVTQRGYDETLGNGRDQIPHAWETHTRGALGGI